MSGYGEHCLFAGTPVDMKVKGVTRIVAPEEEHELHRQYGYGCVTL